MFASFNRGGVESIKNKQYKDAPGDKPKRSKAWKLEGR